VSQIALPFIPGSGPDAGRIIVGPANRAAIEALSHPDRWPYGTAVLFGPPRSGKSLLGRWVAGQGGAAVLDEAHRMDESAVFHRWNRAQEQGTRLLLIGAERWEISLPDLRSRIGAALQLEIGAPDDELMAALIEHHAAARGLVLGEGAPTYLVPRIERSFAAIERVVATIDRLSLERKAPATLAIWRDALAAVQGPEQGRLL